MEIEEHRPGLFRITLTDGTRLSIRENGDALVISAVDERLVIVPVLANRVYIGTTP